MFAVFSKVAWLLLQPSALIAMALVWGLWRLRRGQVIAARRWLTGGVVALLVAGFSPLGDLLVMGLEDRFPRPELAGTRVDGIIVIGGAEVASVAAARGVIAVNDAAERYIEAAVLARQYPTARIVFAGGGEVFSGAGESEAQSASRILQGLGVEHARLTLEDRSKTTWENAVFAAPMIAQKPGERWLLITSAWQMPRAIGAFRKAGLNVEAFPVDYRTTGKTPLRHWHATLSEGLRRFDTVVREYPGLLVYWLSGRSSALFPAP